MHSTPSQRVKTTGYFAGSKMNRSVAPAATWRLTLLSSWMAPVSHSPGGTTTRPPPAWWHAAMAAAIAAVQSVPGFAPKSVIGKSRAGNTGALMLREQRRQRSQPRMTTGLAGVASSPLDLDAGEDERAGALGVVVHDGLGDVIFEGAVARRGRRPWCSPGRRPSRLGQPDRAVGIGPSRSLRMSPA
jgi:hypothetical protein